MGNVAVLHDEAKQGRVTGRGGWVNEEGAKGVSGSSERTAQLFLS